MMNTRKPDDFECETDKGFDCFLTGKSLDLKARSKAYGNKVAMESRKNLWVKI